MKARLDNGHNTRSLFPKLLLVFVLLIILLWAAVRAYAAWQFLAARSITTVMLESEKVTQAAILDATDRLRQALRVFPNKPEYLELAGQLQDLQARQPGVVGKAYREALASAADFHRRALEVRPLWPYSWAGLLRAKDGLGEIDDEFRLAMSRSVQTGPQEPSVQLQVIRSGLRHWDVLRATERAIIEKQVSDALVTQPRLVFEIIRSYARPDLICDQAIDYRQINQWCALVNTSDQP